MDVESPTSLFPYAIFDIGQERNAANRTRPTGVKGAHSYLPLETVVLPPLGEELRRSWLRH
jgi:hypothetical protein